MALKSSSKESGSRIDFLTSEEQHQPVLVVVFLRGGADGLTLAPPHGDDAYHRARPTLAVPGSGLHDLNGYIGLNKSMSSLMPLWEEGLLALHHGVGSNDVTRSHFAAQDLMEHGGQIAGGWLARFLRHNSGAQGPLSSVAIGTTMPESLRGAPGGAVVQSIDEFKIGTNDRGAIDRLRRLYEATPGPLGEAGKGTLDAINRLHSLKSGLEPQAPEAYPDSRLGRGLREIAKLIKAQVGLVASTIDAVGGGLGWDTHFVQSTAIHELMKDLADSIRAFVADLDSYATQTKIVVMTEFGRRVSENSSFGTDHGSGSLMLTIGQDLPGGAGVFSHFDDLSSSHLLGPGDVPVGSDYRHVLSDLLGTIDTNCDMERVFPDLNGE